MAHELRFFHCRHAVEDILLQHTVARIGVDGEVAHSKRGQVLEEVRTLRGVYVVVLQARLHDDARCRDVRPLDGYAQPVVARPPSSRTYQHVVLVLSQEPTVDLLYLVSYPGIVGCREVVVGLHIHHVHHILRDAVSQRVVRAQQALFVGNGSQVFVQHLLGVDDGPYLQQVESPLHTSPRRGGLQVAGKLNLHGPTHLLRPVFLRQLQYLWQREDAVLQHPGEGDYFASSLIDAVADNLVVGVVGRRDAIQCSVLVGLLHPEVQDVEAVIHLEVVAHVAHVQSVEAGLGLFQCRIQLRGLQHLLGVIGTHAQRLSTVHDILAQSQCQRGDTLFRQLVAYGVVVQRAQHPREGGIETLAILFAHHLLQYHRHFLLVYHVRRSRHIGLRVLVVHRGIDTLDGTGQHAQHLVLVVQVGNHIGGVDACEGLVVGVFEQRRASDRDGALHRIEEGKEVGYQCIGQLCLQEVLQYLLVRGVAQRNAPQVVLVHELVEEVGTQHHRLGYLHGGVVEVVQLRVSLDDVVQEGQSAPLASQRAVADAGEVGIAVELQTVEDSHHTDVLHPAVLHNGVEDNLPVGIHVLQLVPGDVLQECRHGEDGPCAEPAAHVVARDVVEHRVVRHLEDVVL